MVKKHKVSNGSWATVSHPGLDLPQALTTASHSYVLVHPGNVDFEGVLPRWAEGTVWAGVGLVARVSGDMSLQNLSTVAAPKGLSTYWAHQRSHVSKSDSQALENTATLSQDLLRVLAAASLHKLYFMLHHKLWGAKFTTYQYNFPPLTASIWG